MKVYSSPCGLGGSEHGLQIKSIRAKCSLILVTAPGVCTWLKQVQLECTWALLLEMWKQNFLHRFRRRASLFGYWRRGVVLLDLVPHPRGVSMGIKPTEGSKSERNMGTWNQSPDEPLVCAQTHFILRTFQFDS